MPLVSVNETLQRFMGDIIACSSFVRLRQKEYPRCRFSFLRADAKMTVPPSSHGTYAKFRDCQIWPQSQGKTLESGSDRTTGRPAAESLREFARGPREALRPPERRSFCSR